MKLLWLCNMAPGRIQGKQGGGLWIDHVLEDVKKLDMELYILCRGDEMRCGAVDGIQYEIFSEPQPHVYLPELENRFAEVLRQFRPDAIHVWGTEYGHTLAMMNACEQVGMLQKTAVSIQGLCSVYAGHYAEGVPYAIQRKSSFRDLVRKDNILQQQEKYALRGALEVKALEKAAHIMGRTDWDRACTYAVNPKARYHTCRETLREPFYEGRWEYAKCTKHRVFASSCVYPVKGFHYLLEAFAQVVKDYPDATLAVPGESFLNITGKARLRQQEYHIYLAELAKKYHIEDKIEFLGSLSAEGMKQAYLDANVFALPSTIENSPNSLGEAMLLGVPCVSGHVGGVTTMMTHGEEGYIYQSTAAYMLAYYIEKVFQMEENAEKLGQNAKKHAQMTHDPKANLEDLLQVYRELAVEP